VLARLASVELASGFSRKVRDGTATPSDRDRVWRLFRTHWRSQYEIVSLTEVVYRRAERLLFRHPLRAADALHLASALVAARSRPESGFQFWTADRRQAQAAAAEGLAVELL
jgi:predicted nucleic acid-binding protein